jgi:aspartate-semialdehyde dehydrogenase
MKTLGLVGATGAVGQTFLDLIDQSDLPIENIKLFASKSSAGKIITCQNKKIPIEEISLASLSQCQGVVFATDASLSQELIPALAAKGILCVDKSSAFRNHPKVPLMVPEVNGELLSQPEFLHFPVVASPNCCTIPLTMVIKALDNALGVKRAIVSTYQSVSGAGKPALDLLTQETQDFFTSHDLSSKKSNLFPKSIAFNVMPFVSSILENGDTDEESKIISETRKVLNRPDFPMGATSVRVPTFVGHGESLTLEMESNFQITQVIEILSTFPGIRVVDEQKREWHHLSPEEQEDNEFEFFVTPREAHGKDDVFVSRIRRCGVFEHGLSLWVVSDNLRKGAALNALQIVQRFFHM